MDGAAVLVALFAAAPPGALVEIRLVPGGSRFVKVEDLPTLDCTEVDVDATYFGAIARGPSGVPTWGTHVWADRDKQPQPSHDQIFPRPSAYVNSGHGHHSFWCLDRVLEPSATLQLGKLAAVAFETDMKVVEAARVMRMPGTLNRKDINNPVPCTVEYLDPDLKYDPDDLMEQMVAAVCARYWVEGMRHAVAMGIGAVLARAGWPVDRAQRSVRLVCQWTEDAEVRDRLTAVRGSVERYQSGQVASSLDLHDLMGDDFKVLLSALGITARDGQILHEGEVIGTVAYTQRDLKEYMVRSGRWAVTEGLPAEWDGSRWAPMMKETFVSRTFNFLSTLHYVVMGEELEFPPTSTLAIPLAGLVIGDMTATPLEPMDPMLLPLLNGVLNLDTGEVTPHDKAVRNRWVAPVEYDPAAICPTWMKFLAEACTPDQVAFLQLWIGYCLMYGNPFQRMLWLYGRSGTGKSTVLKVLQLLLGEAAVAIKADHLDEYMIAEVATAKVATCSEIGRDVLKTSTLKALVAGDATQGRRPYGRPFPVEFRGKVCWSSNSLPPVDEGEGMWRRLVVLEMNNIPAAPDYRLWEKLAMERSGILNWAIVGLVEVRRLLAGGLDLPITEGSLSLVESYRDSTDWGARFVEEEVRSEEGAILPQLEVYRRYCYWARERGLKQEGLGPVFWREMENQGLQLVETEPLGRHFVGVVLRPEVFGG